MKRNAGVALLTAALTAGMLTGMASAEEASGGTRTITYYTTRAMSNDVIVVINDLAEQYKAEGHDIDFKIESFSDTDAYDQKLRAMAASDTLPDLFEVDGDTFCEELAASGKVVDMEAYLKEIGAYDDFIPASVDYVRVTDGSLYGIPLEFASDMFWYDVDTFAKYGLEKPKTMDDFLNVCQVLKENGETPLIVDGADGWYYGRFLAMYPFRRSGNDYVYQLKSGEAKMSDELGMEALNFVAELGQYFQPGFASTDYFATTELFLAGEGVMTHMGTSLLEQFMEVEGKNIDYFYIPMTEDAVTTENEYWVFGGLGIAASTATWDDEVADFLEYVVKNFSEPYTLKGHFSAQKVEVDTSSMPELYQKIVADNAKVGDVVTRPWDIILPDTVWNVFNENLVSVASGQMSPEECASLVDEALEASLQ